LITNFSNVRKIVAGHHFDYMCAIKIDNSLWCWGSNTHGQLGTGDSISRQFPTLISSVGSVSNVGTSHGVTFVIKNDGTFQELGTEDAQYLNINTSNGLLLSQLNGQVETLCGLSLADIPYCWGYNGNYVLGYPSGSSYDSTGNVPVPPYVSTLNTPPPGNLVLDSTSGPVGQTVSVSGTFLNPTKTLFFGNQSVPFTISNGNLVFQVPSWASVGSIYSLTATSIAGSAFLPNAFTVTQSPIVTVNLTMTTLQSGSSMPITGGSYTWLSQGRFSPASAALGDSTGNVTLTNVVSGPGQIILSGGQLPDGTTVSGSWNVNLANGSLMLQANPPTPPALINASATIAFPDGTPVPGAVLTASGLSGSYTDSNSNYSLTYYLPSAITSAVSDSNGLAILYGYQGSPTVLGTATYNDTVLVQSTQPSQLTPNGVATPITFDYAPFLTTSTPALSTVAGSTAALTFTDLNNATPVPNQTVTLTQVSVTAPPAAASIKPAGPNCPTTFSGITDASGNVTIPLCTAIAGLHTYSVTSLGSINQDSTVTLNVSTPVAATTFSLTGPASGVVNQTSNAFTISPDGLYTGTVTISISGGGMNNSIPLNFTNSAVPQSFTITPIALGSVTVSVSSTPALLNPASLTYTVNPPPASSYTLTGPTSGAQGATSTSFTVTPNGVYSGIINVAVSGGGMATTIPLTFTNSAAAQTFVITPSVSGTVILTATSSPKITNPISRTYSVSPAGLTPILSITNVGSSGFVVNVTNYNSAYKFRATSSAGSVTAGVPTSSNQPFTVSGLTPGQTASVTVTSSRTNYSTVSSVISGSAQSVPATPAAPTGVAGNSQVTLTWSAPASNGATIDSYTITQSTSSTGPFTASSASCTAINALTCIATGLTNGNTYYFELTAHNAIGSSAASPSTTAVTLAPVAQATLTIANTVLTGTVGTAITLSTSGGSGTGTVSYATTGTGCSVSGTSLTATAATTCVVTATKAASTGYLVATSATKSFVFSLALQATLTISNSNTSTIAKGTTGITLATTGGSGTGAVTFAVTGSGCTLVGSKLSVATTVSPGVNVSCSVVATKAASGIYAAISSIAKIFSFL